MIEKIIPTVHEWIQNIIFERDEDILLKGKWYRTYSLQG